MDSISVPPTTVSGQTHEVFRYWKNPDNYPLFMTNVTVVVLTPNELFCSGAIASEDQREWYCDLVMDDQNLQIRWRTDDALSDVSVVLTFSPDADNPKENTVIAGAFTLLEDKPTAGVDRLVKRQLTTDLRRFRDTLKSGELRLGPPVERLHADEQNIEKRFEMLAADWRRATRMHSSVTYIVSHPTYQAIIAMGEVVVPFILRDLARQSDYWMYALGIITGENPVSQGMAGNMEQMAQTWVTWGRSKGLIEHD
jgi:hypothetical protein